MDWLRIDESGEKQTLFDATASGAYGGYALNVGAPDQVILFSASTLGSGPADFLSTVVKAGVTTTAPAFVTLFNLSAFSQKFGFVGSSPALDGERGVFAAGAGRDYSVAVIAADGSVVGTPQPMRVAPDYATCQGLQPTDHAAALTVVEAQSDGSEVFHRLELTAAGDVAWELKLPFDRARPPDWRASSLPCPLLALTPDGIALLAYETVADHDAWHLHRIGRDGTASDELWEALSNTAADVPRGLALQGQAAFALSVGNDAPVTIVKRSDGQDQQFPIDVHLTILGNDGPFPAEAGSLFLDVRPNGDGRQIVEVTCP
jgi:hypothetical protein